jgi:very-short-patch-repair endonuclease
MTAYLTKYAKRLRKNETQAESLLWSRLRARRLAGVKFRRQQPIGKMIVDFVSFERRVVIELDGGQHATAELKVKDEERDRFLRKGGFTVLRFWDNEIFVNLEGVLEVIRRECG